MKKIISILIFCLLIVSVQSLFAQNYGIVPTADTLSKTAFRFRVNQSDNKLYYSDKVSYKRVSLNLSDTATLDFASSGATTVSDLTKTIPGARLNDAVYVGAPAASVTATGTFYGWVSASNTVTIRFSPKATENPASGVFTIVVLKR